MVSWEEEEEGTNVTYWSLSGCERGSGISVAVMVDSDTSALGVLAR